MSQARFKRALEKGALGESIVRGILESKGWVVYQPMTNGPHAFDMLSIRNKKRAIAIDVKAKARMNAYPATGINECHHAVYSAFSERHSMPFWLFFVDESLKMIYGNSIEELDKPRVVDSQSYPWIMPGRKPIRLWPLSAMIEIAKIDDEQSLALEILNQRKYEFKPA